MDILGIAHDLWISSAALVRDGKVVAAVCEERLNRQKKYKGFPNKSVDYCLRSAGITIDDVDLIVSGWNPAQHMEGLHPRFSHAARWRPEYLYALPNHLLQKARHFPFGPVEEKFGDFKAPIVFIDHQLAHVANAFYLSPFEEAALFSADGRGERHTAMLGIGDSAGIQPLQHVTYPHSLGLFYGLITQYLGFAPDGDEWKVMALSSFGSADDNEFYPLLRDMITVRNDGTFRLDLSLCGFHQPDINGARMYTPDFVEHIGLPPRKSDASIDRAHYQLAWALQKVFEETISAILTHLQKKTGLDTVALSGGCMMNSVYNGRVSAQTPFKQVFISSCPDDSGISVGAALWGYFNRNENPQRIAHPDNYWGPNFDAEIEKTLSMYKLTYQVLEDPARTAAELLVEGKLIGWFQGAMEFGQRALGNRSILADPRREDAKDLVNMAVKYRESFRPFAPSILVEAVDKFFHTESDGHVPFMEKVYDFRNEVKHLLPAVVHVDGTGRLQTVSRENNPLYYDLIQAFNELTGVPVILNTSFNLNGEAIVCSPTDAIRTFYSCGLNALIMGKYLIRK